MPRTPKPRIPRDNLARREIASLAARLMAEDGIDDYGYAKRKAARQLGLPDDEALPNNAEVEAELRIYQALYQSEEHPARLRELRLTALEVMRFLSDFTPYLTGQVLDGTAGRYAEIELDVFAESAKEVEIFLINHDMRYEHGRTPQTQGDAPEAVLMLDWSGTPLRLTIYNAIAERNRRTNRAGRTFERARIAAVEDLLREALP